MKWIFSHQGTYSTIQATRLTNKPNAGIKICIANNITVANKSVILKPHQAMKLACRIIKELTDDYDYSKRK